MILEQVLNRVFAVAGALAGGTAVLAAVALASPRNSLGISSYDPADHVIAVSFGATLAAASIAWILARIMMLFIKGASALRVWGWSFALMTIVMGWSMVATPHHLDQERMASAAGR